MFCLFHIYRHQLSYAQLTEQLENRTAELLLLAQSEEHQQEELKKVFHIIKYFQILSSIKEF